MLKSSQKMALKLAKFGDDLRRRFLVFESCHDTQICLVSLFDFSLEVLHQIVVKLEEIDTNFPRSKGVLPSANRYFPDRVFALKGSPLHHIRVDQRMSVHVPDEARGLNI